MGSPRIGAARARATRFWQPRPPFRSDPVRSRRRPVPADSIDRLGGCPWIGSQLALHQLLTNRAYQLVTFAPDRGQIAVKRVRPSGGQALFLGERFERHLRAGADVLDHLRSRERAESGRPLVI